MLSSHCVRLYTFFSPSTIYILLLIFSPDPLYSREYSRILRIFLPRGRSTEAKNRSKVEVCAPKPLRNVQNLKFPSASTQNLLLRGKRAVPRSSSQDRSRRRDCNVENIQEYLETRGQPRSRAEESSYILEKKAGRGIYILENILEYESARDPLYSQSYSRITCIGARHLVPLFALVVGAQR